jgi:uncharacterized protein (DUF885 family)
MSDQFGRLAKTAIAAYFQAHPAEATQLGNHAHDEQLADLSQSATDRRRRELGSLLTQLDELTGLDVAAAVDRAMLRTEAGRELLSLEMLDEPSWDVPQYNPGPALYALIAQDFAPLADRLSSVAGRLRAVPDYFAAARQRLTDPPRVYLEAAIGQLAGTHAMITGEIAELSEQAGRQAELADPIDRAAAAVLEFQDWLHTLLPKAQATFRLGEQPYADKLSLTLHTAWRPADLLARAYTDLARIEAELAELAGTDGHASRADIAAELDHLATDQPESATIVDRCRAALAESTRFVEQHQLLTLLHDPVEVGEMPEIFRGPAVAYCQPVGPLETAPLPTRFAICPASPAWPAEQVRAYYREYNNHALQNITVHEAMPGHVEQLSHARRYRDDTLVRSVFESHLFTEGWAVYAEELMVEHGYRSEVSATAARSLRLHQLMLQLRRVIAAILDISLHAGDLDQAGAIELMTRRGHISEADAARRWPWLQLVATQPPLYFVGRLEMRGLVRDLRAAHPDWSEQRLHDTILSYGSPPTQQLRTLLGLAIETV